MAVSQPKLVTIIGGSGFIGTQLVQQLAKRGYRVRVGVRRPDLAGHLRPLGNVGQVQPVQVNVRNMDSIMANISGSDAVVNLVGILHEAGKQKFDAVHTIGAANVAKAVKATGIETFVHMSAMGADADSESAYLRSRALGETEALAACPKAIIVRPSLVFGTDDSFFNRFGAMARMLPFLPLVGADTKFQPIFVGDVADTLAAAVDGKVKGGKAYEIGGPEVVTMRNIMELVNLYANRKRPLIEIPTGLASFMATFSQILPNPILTVDQVASLQTDNVVSAEADKEKRNLKAFGITPTGMDDVLPDYMWRFRKHGEFERVEI